MFYRYLIPPQGWLTAKQSCTKVVRSNSSQVFIKCLLFFYQNIAFCLGWRKRIWVRRQLLLKLPLLEALQLELGWCRWALALAMRGTAIWPFCHHFVTRPSKQSGTSFGAPWVLIIFCGGFFLKKMIFFWISGWHRTTWQGTLPNRTTPSEGPSDCSTWLLHDKLSQKNHDTGMFSWWKHIKNYGEVKSDKKGAHTQWHGDTNSKHCCCDFDSFLQGNLRRCLRGRGSGDWSAARGEGHRAWEDETAGVLSLEQLILIWAVFKPWLVVWYRGLYYPIIWG